LAKGSGMKTILRTLVAATSIAFLPLAPPALAHHVMGGKLPDTAWYGLLSGLGHPIIGIDHLAFVLGVGLMAYLAGRIVLLPVLLVAGTVLGCALHGVCSLDVLAAQHGRQTTDFVVATDARRHEVYWARYGPDAIRIGQPQVSAPEAVPDLPVVGPAADLYADRLRAVPGPRVLDPGILALAGPGLPDAGHEPLYLRRPDATESVRRKSVLHYGGGRR